MAAIKPKVTHYVEKQFANFNKWETYANVFSIMDARKVTLKHIILIASAYGISEGVIRMRRRDILNLKKWADSTANVN